MSQVYKSYQKPLDHNDLWHNLDDNMVYVFDKNKNEWKPLDESRMGVKLCFKRIKPIREKIVDVLIKRGQLVSGRSKIY